MLDLAVRQELLTIVRNEIEDALKPLQERISFLEQDIADFVSSAANEAKIIDNAVVQTNCQSRDGSASRNESKYLKKNSKVQRQTSPPKVCHLTSTASQGHTAPHISLSCTSFPVDPLRTDPGASSVTLTAVDESTVQIGKSLEEHPVHKRSSTAETQLVISHEGSLRFGTVGKIASSTDVKNLFVRLNTHTISSSMWEACSLMFMHCVGLKSTASLLLGLIVNMLMQGGFGYFLVHFLSQAEEHPDLSFIQKWRNTDGHDYRNLDVRTQTSLVSRVCSQDYSLAIGRGQEQLLEVIREYREDLVGFAQSPLAGLVLCSLTLAIWLLMVMKEFWAMSNFLRAMGHLPRGPRTIMRYDEGTFKFEMISIRRLTLIIVISICRAAIAGIFAYWGGKFLANTKSIEDLVLNSVALGFVLEIDELCCHVFARARHRTLLDRMEPIQLPRMHGRRKIVFYGMNVLLFTSVSAAVILRHMIPQAQRSYQLAEAMCGGRRNFALGVNADSGLLYTVATMEIPTDTLERALEVPTWYQQQVSKLRNAPRDNPESVDTVVHTNSVSTFLSRVEMPMSSLVAQRAFACRDSMFSALPTFAVEALRMQTQKVNATGCSDLRDKCFGLDQKYLRMNCPETCGCGKPVSSGQLMTYALDGCPEDACRVSDTYKAELKAIQCGPIDPSPQVLMAMPAWKETWNSLVEYWGRFSEKQRKEYKARADTFLQEGCGALNQRYEAIIGESMLEVWCAGQAYYPRLALFCPVACGCLDLSSMGARAAVCPPSCGNGSAGSRRS